jgi:hypothetical protein
VNVSPDGDDVCSYTQLGSKPRRVRAEGKFGAAVGLRVNQAVRSMSPCSSFCPVIVTARIPVHEVSQLVSE